MGLGREKRLFYKEILIRNAPELIFLSIKHPFLKTRYISSSSTFLNFSLSLALSTPIFHLKFSAGASNLFSPLFHLFSLSRCLQAFFLFCFSPLLLKESVDHPLSLVYAQETTLQRISGSSRSAHKLLVVSLKTASQSSSHMSALSLIMLLILPPRSKRSILRRPTLLELTLDQMENETTLTA